VAGTAALPQLSEQKTEEMRWDGAAQEEGATSAPKEWQGRSDQGRQHDQTKKPPTQLHPATESHNPTRQPETHPDLGQTGPTQKQEQIQPPPNHATTTGILPSCGQKGCGVQEKRYKPERTEALQKRPTQQHQPTLYSEEGQFQKAIVVGQ